MLFLLPIASALTVTVGEAIGMGIAAFGIGAGIKGAHDYQKAKKLKAEAEGELRKMARRIRRQSMRLKKSLQRFGRLKLEAYAVAIGNAVKVLSQYRAIDLTACKAVSVESVRFIGAELGSLEEACVKASDVLSCISVGISAAANDRIPYKSAPALVEIIGAFGLGKAANGLPAIPYAGIAMAGISWGISGSHAKANAEAESAEARVKAKRMSRVISGLKAMETRIAEGEALVFALSKKLKASLDALQSSVGEGGGLSEGSAKEVDAAVWLVKSLKQVIEADICDADGFLGKESGIAFRKIEQEVQYA